MNSSSYPAAYMYNEGEKSVFPNDDDIDCYMSILYKINMAQQHIQIYKKEIDLFIKKSNIVVISYYSTNEIADIAIKIPEIKFGILNQHTFPKIHQAFIKNQAFEKKYILIDDQKIFYDFKDKNAYLLGFSLTEEEFKKQKLMKYIQWEWFQIKINLMISQEVVLRLLQQSIKENYVLS